MEISTKASVLTLGMGIDHWNPEASQKGGTAMDDGEMHRMGKIQEFKVRTIAF